MLQEIITYIIIAGAVGMALQKILRKPQRKRKLQENKTDNSPEEHFSGCSACPADCMWRNSPAKDLSNTPPVCEKATEKD